jgi:H(+)-transporting ATP synthase subunit D
MTLRIRWKTRRTRYELLKLKDQLELAQKAHTLLEEKYKMLMQEAAHIRMTLLPLQEELVSKAEKSYMLLSEAICSLGLRKVYRAALSSNANDNVEIRWDAIRGFSTPRLTSKIRVRTPLERGYGLTDTNNFLDLAAGSFEETTISLIEVAELENVLRILEKETRETGIRVLALEKVMIPSLENEVKTIEEKLEEKEREGHIMIKWFTESLQETL